MYTFPLKVKVLVTQSCLTLCHPMDYSLPDSSVHGSFQARILEWVAIPFSGALLNSGIKPGSPALQVGSLWFPLKHTNLHSQSVIEVSESLYPHFKKDFNFER